MENPWLIRIIGVILFLGGLVLRYVIARRQFNRRSITGLQQFRSYETA